MNMERVAEKWAESRDKGHERGRILRRQWEIYALLKANSRGLTAKQISEKVKTPYRTIVRDLDTMLSVMPIYYDVVPTGEHERGRTFKWKLMPER